MSTPNQAQACTLTKFSACCMYTIQIVPDKLIR